MQDMTGLDKSARAVNIAKFAGARPILADFGSPAAAMGEQFPPGMTPSQIVKRDPTQTRPNGIPAIFARSPRQFAWHG
ncbi:hypothetical protein [Bradyrhizobium sp. SZCCHNR1051]|uniref:hypothetical protein n=1 Tax=Bradyrhizobium sp. SZCCHNR1051 TaxID=3057355 RepID=UPI0029160901|nr:hypothetical protein [Bradyrhizobium sp. SZCCHNR1051]